MIYPFARIFLGIPIRLFIRKIHGKNNLPKDKPFIIASNHASFIDDLMIPYAVTTIVNKKFHIYVNSRFYKNKFLELFLNYFGCIKVDVGKDVKDDEQRKRTNAHAFNLALMYLKAGEVFGIFPEGTRSKDGKLRKAKTGMAKIALSSKVCVVPVGIMGSYDIMPKGAKFPRSKRADIHIGKPLTFEKYYGKEDSQTLENVTTQIMQEIAKLTKQVYPK